MRSHPKISLLVQRLTKEAGNRGQIIDIGWRAYRAVMLSQFQSLPADMEEQFRYAYYSGAEHLFMSIMGVMDDDREPTDNDLAVMTKVHAEVEAFQRELEGYIALHMKTGGSA